MFGVMVHYDVSLSSVGLKAQLLLQMSDEPKLYVAEEMKEGDVITEQHVCSVCPGFG